MNLLSIILENKSNLSTNLPCYSYEVTYGHNTREIDATSFEDLLKAISEIFLLIEYLCIQKLRHRISLLLGLYFHFYLFLDNNVCEYFPSWILETPKQNFRIQDFLDTTRSIHKRSFFPHAEGPLHDHCWVTSVYPFPVYSNL